MSEGEMQINCLYILFFSKKIVSSFMNYFATRGCESFKCLHYLVALSKYTSSMRRWSRWVLVDLLGMIVGMCIQEYLASGLARLMTVLLAQLAATAQSIRLAVYFVSSISPQVLWPVGAPPLSHTNGHCVLFMGVGWCDNTKAGWKKARDRWASICLADCLWCRGSRPPLLLVV